MTTDRDHQHWRCLVTRSRVGHSQGPQTAKQLEVALGVQVSLIDLEPTAAALDSNVFNCLRSLYSGGRVSAYFDSPTAFVVVVFKY